MAVSRLRYASDRQELSHMAVEKQLDPTDVAGLKTESTGLKADLAYAAGGVRRSTMSRLCKPFKAVKALRAS